MTQEQASDLFARSPRQGRAWAIGESPVPFETATLIKLVLAGRLTMRRLQRMRRNWRG